MDSSGNVGRTAIRVQGLSRQFGEGRGILDVSLHVPMGSITGFIGVNGAGKSTTLRCIMGLIRPDAGTIELFGRPADLAGRRRIGFLPEERGLFPRERARDVIAFQARLKGADRKVAFHTADRLLERVGLDARKSARIETLSKGNAQRVQILCALAHRPDLLILDEPLSGLDPIGQSEIHALFAEFRAGGGAIFLSTHSMAAAEAVCDRVVVLAAGRAVFEGDLKVASGHAPHGAVVVTADSRRLADAALAVGGEARLLAAEAGSARMGQAERWRVVMPAHVAHETLTAALAAHEVPVFAFEPIKTDLEGAFWVLAGRRASDLPARTLAGVIE